MAEILKKIKTNLTFFKLLLTVRYEQYNRNDPYLISLKINKLK